MIRMEGIGGMEDSLKRWLEDALVHYDRVVFLYQFSQASCIGLRRILKKEQRKILLLTDTEVFGFTCSQRTLCEEECRGLLELYFSYCFADNFIFLTDQKEFPWPSPVSFSEAGVSEREKIWEAMLH